MKLNYRDKIIVGVLLAIIICVAGFFALIKPKYADIKDNKETLKAVEKERDEIDAKIAQIKPLQDEIKKTYQDTNALVGDFVDYNKIFDARKVDQYMQRFAEGAKVKVTSLTASDLSTGTLNYYYFSTTFPGMDMLEQADLNGDRMENYNEVNAESLALTGRTAETVLRAQYSITVKGEKKELWDYMKALEDQKETMLINSISIQNLEMKEKKNQPPVAEKDKPEVTANIVVTLYSVYELSEPVLD